MRFFALFAVLAALILTATAGASSLNIGESTVLPTFDSGNGDLLVAQSASLAQDATIQSLSFYVVTAAGNLRLGIYDDSGPSGGPGALKAQTASFAPTAGWNTQPVVTPVSLTAGTYWLAYLASSNTLSFRKIDDSSSSGVYYSQTFGTLPDTYSTSPSTTPSHWSFYATLSVADPPPPACSDGIDNDSPPDGLIDYPNDPGCTSASDTSEADSVNTCTQTLSAGSDVAQAIIDAPAGSVICLSSGSYDEVILTSVSKASDVMVRPADGASVTINSGTTAAINVRMVDHVRFSGLGGTMTVQGLIFDQLYDQPSNSNHMTFDHITWSSGLTVWMHGTDQAVLFDYDTFDNLQGGLYEGRLTVVGENNTAPVGLTVANSHFGGNAGCSDGVQIIGGAYGVQVGPNNEFEDIQQGSCEAHSDPVQLYGTSHTLITGNFFHDNSTGIMAVDGADHEQFINNVFVVSPGGYPQVFQLGSHVGTTIQHNTFAGTDSDIGFCGQKPNSGLPPSSGCIVRDNVYAGSVNPGTIGGNTEDHNLCRDGESACADSSDVHGVPTYVGGASPMTYGDYRLAPGSLGKGAASDGTDIGIN